MRSGSIRVWRPRPAGFAPGADVARERELLADADVFAFIYPLWFNVPRAVVTGYVQRVFGMGFGYGPIREGRNQPLPEGRRREFGHATRLRPPEFGVP
jgi:NAD(P)H dehydrogenase (quinone)